MGSERQDNGLADSSAWGTLEPPYVVALDPVSGLITCRITGPLWYSIPEKLAVEFGEAMVAARRHHPRLRMLWDDREKGMISAEAYRLLVDRLRPRRRPGDRSAVLVSSSLMKVRMRPNTLNAQIFVSESAAMTWLNAWG